VGGDRAGRGHVDVRRLRVGRIVGVSEKRAYVDSRMWIDIRCHDDPY
jgi:hypothetical protein